VKNYSQRFLIFCLGGMALTLPLSIAVSSIFYFSLLGVYLLTGVYSFREWPLSWGALEKTFALFFGISVLSAAFGLSHKRTLDALGSDLYFLILVLLVALVTKESQGKKLVQLFLWASLISSVYGVVQYSIGVNELDQVLLNVPSYLKDAPKGFLKELAMMNGRVVGTRSHPLTYAECLLFPLAYVMVKIFVDEKPKWWCLAFLVLSSAIVVSQSRGPWLAVIAMGLTLLVFIPMKRIALRGWVFLLPLLFIFFGSHFRDRAASIANMHHGSNSERLRMWRAGMEMTHDRPILGIGPGSMKFVSSKYQSASDQRWGAWGHLHNNFVHIMAERGILGLSAFVALFFILFKTFLKRLSLKSKAANTSQHLALFGMLTLVGFLVSGLTETNYNDTEVLMSFYFALGLALKTGILPTQTR
jgi:putative inorganic carbon (hco3(-)) transporter